LAEGQRPVFRPGEPYVGLDTSKLPSGSVVVDNEPAGHVYVQNTTPQILKDAVIERGRFPK
jgi:hypothetical protein